MGLLSLNKPESDLEGLLYHMNEYSLPSERPAYSLNQLIDST